MIAQDNLKKDIAAVQSIPAVPNILDVLCRMTGMGFAAVARVTENRWILCQSKDDISFGLNPGDELKIETTICHEIRQHRNPVIIDNVAEDKTYCNHHTPAMYGIQSYISMPIILKDGTFFGTLCAIDAKPASLNRVEVVNTFRLFAELIAFHLDAIDQMSTTQAQLDAERKSSAQREQFIAVLSHDLRNPLGAIMGGLGMLGKITPLNAKGTAIVEMTRSSAARMNELISNVMDFARLRMGSGIGLIKEPMAMAPILEHVVQELRAIRPTRVIESDFRLEQPIACDHARVSQLLSNLLANALTHGSPKGAVFIRGVIDNGIFELSVSNSGNPIPAEMIPHLFEAFTSEEAGIKRQGLGLGLYIASQIAAAHGGNLSAISTPEETRFTFRMPV